MDREFAGQPVWLWAVGAAVVVGGYLYITHKSSSASSSSAPAPSGGGGKSKSTTTFHETITDLQSAPKGGK